MMATLRRLFVLVIANFVLVTTPASALPDSGSGAKQSLVSELPRGWHLVRTPNPKGGADAISITHPADTSRSDLDLAGLMIRCGKTNAEVVIILLPALSFRARPHVTFGKPGNESQFEATVAPPGTAVLLPADATTLVSGPWHALDDLFIRIDEGHTIIRGVVKLTGLQAAFKKLQASCRAQ
jgi:hypothetical protein